MDKNGNHCITVNDIDQPGGCKLSRSDKHNI